METNEIELPDPNIGWRRPDAEVDKPTDAQVKFIHILIAHTEKKYQRDEIDFDDMAKFWEREKNLKTKQQASRLIDDLKLVADWR